MPTKAQLEKWNKDHEATISKLALEKDIAIKNKENALRMRDQAQSLLAEKERELEYAKLIIDMLDPDEVVYDGNHHQITTKPSKSKQAFYNAQSNLVPF